MSKFFVEYGDAEEDDDKWFVMLYSQDGKSIMPLAGYNEDVELFNTRKEAVEAANKNIYGEAFGFTVYLVGADVLV